MNEKIVTKQVETTPNSSNLVEMPNGSLVPIETLQFLTAVFTIMVLGAISAITLGLREGIKHNINRKIFTQELREKFEEQQKRLIYVQQNYVKYVDSGVNVYYDQKIDTGFSFNTFSDDGQKVLKQSFKDFLKDLMETQIQDRKQNHDQLFSNNDPDKSYYHYKTVGQYAGPSNILTYNIELEFILSGNTFNWIVSLIEDERQTI